MMEYGDIGIKDGDDVILALKSGATARELREAYGERISGLLASALDSVRPTVAAPRQSGQGTETHDHRV